MCRISLTLLSQNVEKFTCSSKVCHTCEYAFRTDVFYIKTTSTWGLKKEKDSLLSLLHLLLPWVRSPFFPFSPPFCHPGAATQLTFPRKKRGKIISNKIPISSFFMDFQRGERGSHTFLFCRIFTAKRRYDLVGASSLSKDFSSPLPILFFCAGKRWQ